MALKYDNGVILAMDCKTSSGSFVTDRSAIKGNQISPSELNYGPIYVLRCGNAAASQVVTRYVYNYLNYHAMELGQNGRIELKTVGTLYKNICYSNKDQLECAFILTNGKEIISIDSSGAMFHHDLFASHGSGSVFVSGFLKFHLKTGLTREEAVDLMTRSVALAINDDTSSGGNIVIIDATKDGVATKTFVDHNRIESLIGEVKGLKI